MVTLMSVLYLKLSKKLEQQQQVHAISLAYYLFSYTKTKSNVIS